MDNCFASDTQEKCTLCGCFVRELSVVGCYDGEGFFNTLGEYVPEQDCWKLVSSMNLRRSGAGIVVGWKPAT